jgi:hypothetical protein
LKMKDLQSFQTPIPFYQTTLKRFTRLSNCCEDLRSCMIYVGQLLPVCWSNYKEVVSDGNIRLFRNVGDYQSTLHNIPEDQRSNLHRTGESLKLHIFHNHGFFQTNFFLAICMCVCVYIYIYIYIIHTVRYVRGEWMWM